MTIVVCNLLLTVSKTYAPTNSCLPIYLQLNYALKLPISFDPFFYCNRLSALYWLMSKYQSVLTQLFFSFHSVQYAIAIAPYFSAPYEFCYLQAFFTLASTCLMKPFDLKSLVTILTVCLSVAVIVFADAGLSRKSIQATSASHLPNSQQNHEFAGGQFS